MAQQIKKIKIGDVTYDIVVEKDWTQTDSTKASYISNKPFDTIDSDTLEVTVGEDKLKKLSLKDRGHKHITTDIEDLSAAIPTKVSDLDNDKKYITIDDIPEIPDSGTTVEWKQEVTAGTKIATITINETPTDVFVPEVTPIQLIHWDEENE